jgi:hypothetical protein
MFGDVVKPSIKVGSQKWYTVPLSIIVHTAIIAAVVIIPLMAMDVADAAVDDGVRRGAAATSPAAATTAPAAGRCAEAGDGRQPRSRAGRSAARDQT